MFRVSQVMQEIAAPTAIGPRRNPPGPVVIWNLVRRCNLTCKHCYSVSADHDFPGELDTSELFNVMQDLKAFRVPVLILSGGEPLLRPDLFDIARRAKEIGFYVGLSTNGTLIDGENIQRIVDLGFDYVGISLDGPSRRKPWKNRAICSCTMVWRWIVVWKSAFCWASGSSPRSSRKQTSRKSQCTASCSIG